jgi:LysR family hydrogen peroxide-inducible transcriptional activator
MENLPTLRQMQYLLALSDAKSFQKAAEACNVTQSTLSGGLKDMESILGSPVIDRSSRKLVRFTPLGESILKQGRAIVSQMEDIAYRARSMNEPLSWPLKMGVIPTIAPYLLPKLLKPLQKSLPKLQLHIHELRSQHIVEKLNDGTIDFALMAFPFDLKGLHEHRLFHEKFVIAAPPGSFKGKSSVTMNDLAHEKILLLEDGHCLREHALEACKLQSLAETKTLSAASLSTLVQLVHQGYGVTFLPEMALGSDAMLPRGLVTRPIKGADMGRDIGFAWKKGGLRDRDIATVVKAMEHIL